MTLDYRSPTTREHRVQRVLSELNTAQTLGTAAMIGKLAFGIPMCLIGPIFLNAIFRAIVRGHAPLPPASVTLLIVAGGLIPLLFWLERRSRGEFASDALQGDSSPWSASSYGEFELQRTKVLWVLYSEVALLGPRLIWSVIDTLSGRTRSDTPLRVVAAEIAVEMSAIEEGIAPQKLVRLDRPAGQVLAALKVLKQSDWVDMSRKGDRVWLTSAARERLGRM